MRNILEESRYAERIQSIWRRAQEAVSYVNSLYKGSDMIFHIYLDYHSRGAHPEVVMSEDDIFRLVDKLSNTNWDFHFIYFRSTDSLYKVKDNMLNRQLEECVENNSDDMRAISELLMR